MTSRSAKAFCVSPFRPLTANNAHMTVEMPAGSFTQREINEESLVAITFAEEELSACMERPTQAKHPFSLATISSLQPSLPASA